MNSFTSRPEFEVALEATIEALKTMKANGGTAQALQAMLKTMMFDEDYLEKQHRQAFLKRVNDAMGTGYSMNQVRKADPASRNAATSKQVADNETLYIPVDELHGEVSISLPTESNNSVNEWEVPQVQPAASSATEQPSTNVTATAAANQPTTTSSEHTTMNTTTSQAAAVNTNAVPVAFVAEATPAVNTPAAPVAPVAPAAPVAAVAPAVPTPATEAVTMNNAQTQSPLQVFLADLTVVGYPTTEQRDELYNVFLSENLAFQPQAKSTAMAGPEGLSNDAQFFAFVSKVPEANTAFQAFAKTFKPARQSAEARSRFSLRGERDEGVRASWVAVGGAVLGAALETGHRGSLTVGSGIGAVAGIVGSFFAGELLEDAIDSDFGRYTAAGTLGLAVGALGSGLGRMAQGAVMGRMEQNSEGTADVPAISTGGKTIELHPSLAALLG